MCCGGVLAEIAKLVEDLDGVREKWVVIDDGFRDTATGTARDRESPGMDRS
jgi:hypothetical protein